MEFNSVPAYIKGAILMSVGLIPGKSLDDLERFKYVMSLCTNKKLYLIKVNTDKKNYCKVKMFSYLEYTLK